MKYPSLPGDALSSAVGAYTGILSLVSVGNALGVQFVMRWKNTGDADGSAGESAVVGRVVQSLIGAVHHEQGPAAARAFIRAHILSRSVDLSSHLKLVNPKLLVSLIFKRLGRPRPVARLLRETGRLSTAPIFVVGMYSGIDKVGEAYGSSLNMAETKACKNAIERHFLKEVKDVELPSDAESEEARLSFFDDVDD
ncbi:hypothetical protein DFJ73DRAFT_518425 [Zopfochytrium polystomum]|nr:hypothetical protein DFJ73DRAFT_518425 [Zopfochytrium polystomum]